MRLISPTLLDSFAYYMDAEGDRGEQARQQLLNRLRGVKTPPTEAMQRGIDFENDVCAMCDGTYQGKEPEYNACVEEVAHIVRGARRQVPTLAQVYRDICAVGYIDFLLPGHIIDTKTTQAYSLGKYRNNTQHLAYLSWGHQNKIDHFEYVVVDWSVMQVFREGYGYQPGRTNAELRSRCREFIAYLDRDAEMKTAFEAHKPHMKGETTNA